MCEGHAVMCNPDGLKHVSSLLNLKPDSSEVFDWDYFALVVEPVACPGNWGGCSFKDLSANVVPCITSISNKDSILGLWFDHEWAFNC